MQRPQTIQIFLPDGSPTSIKEAELTNRLVKAVLFPRNKLNEVAKRELVHFTGVYFLFGSKEDEAKPIVYIGEGEDCYKRILAHNRNKDFWTHCVVVATKTNEYTKTDGKFLEHYSIGKAQEISRYALDNDTGSRRTSISESREYDLLDNFETLKILLATLGYPLFEEKRKPLQQTLLFYCQGKDYSGQGEYTDDGFIVLKGSKCVLEESSYAGDWIANIRSKLKEQNILQLIDGQLVFMEDYIFSSPSGSAAVICGRNNNGWMTWKTKEGKTLDEVKRK